MSKKQIKRSWFFWIDRLQISKRERQSVVILVCVLAICSILILWVEQKTVAVPENHAALLKEFQQKSALIERERLEFEKKYTPLENVASSTQHSEEIEMSVPQETELSASAKISVNSANAQELTTLPGIGKTYAERIIEYRETNGDFKSVEELTRVKGIGERTLEKLKPFIKLYVQNVKL